MAINAKRPEIKPFSIQQTLKHDDTLVLCSDGLWGPVPETLIWAAANELSPQQAAEKLVAQANSKQGPDNISVVIARRFNPDRMPAAVDMEDTNPGF
jgi:protein phosphatase